MTESIKKQRLAVHVPDWPAPRHVLACTTLRQTVDSENPYSGFNLATHVGDDISSVITNRENLVHAISLPAEPLWLSQIHSTNIIEITDSSSHIEIPEADASITTCDDIVCAILTADCLPLLVTDINGRAVAAIHAGWRGLAQGIIKNSIEQFCSRLDITAQDCLVWLGPAIGQSCFEVGADVYGEITSKIEQAETAFIKKKNQKYGCDLYHLARLELNSLGISNIFGGDQCTYTQDKDYYSHRRHTHQLADKLIQNQQKNCGRMATMIWLSSNNR